MADVFSPIADVATVYGPAHINPTVQSQCSSRARWAGRLFPPTKVTGCSRHIMNLFPLTSYQSCFKCRFFFLHGHKRITEENTWMNITVSDNVKKRNKLRERGTLAPGFAFHIARRLLQTDDIHQLSSLSDVFMPCNAYFIQCVGYATGFLQCSRDQGSSGCF